MLKGEIATLRCETDTTKTQETVTKTVSEYNGELNVLTGKSILLSSELKKEKENKERLETS